MARFQTAAFLTATLLAAGSAAAQFDREMDSPTDSRTFFGLSVAGVDTLVQQGYRVSDLEVTSATQSSIHFSGTAVRNTGPYATNWWWYYGQTPLQLLSHANQHGARLIDVERYIVGSSIQYAGVMVANPGPNPIQWYLWPEVRYADVAGLISNAGARLIDVEHHLVNGEDRLTLLAVRNQGAQARTWYYYFDYTLQHIEAKMSEHESRPIDLEWIGPNRYAAILVHDDVGPTWRYYGYSAATLLERESYHLARAFDIERYLDGGTPRYLALMVDNFANFEHYGTACATGNGQLDHDVPIGNGFGGFNTWYHARNMTPGSMSVLLFGAQQTAIDLGLVGAAGCTLYTQPLVSLPAAVGNTGEVTHRIGIPDDVSLVNQQVFTQFVSFDRWNTTRPLATSNGIITTIRD